MDRKVSKTWTHGYVGALLVNPALKGEYQAYRMETTDKYKYIRVPVGPVIKDYFPVIISEDEWNETRNAMRQRSLSSSGKQGPDIANLFQGLIRDATTGLTMHLIRVNNTRDCANTRRLVARDRDKDTAKGQLSFPYDPIEREFLKRIRELKASDVQGKVDDKEREIAALAGKVGELDRKIAKVQKRIREQPGIDALITLLEQLDRDWKEAKSQLEQARIDAAGQSPVEALGSVISLSDLLDKVEGEERVELRLKIKARIRQLVKEMGMLVWDVTPDIRAAELQIVFAEGTSEMLFAWHRKGMQRGKVVGAWSPFFPHAKKPTPLFSAYRTDPKVTKALDKRMLELKVDVEEMILA
jgi:hypothetical protein